MLENQTNQIKNQACQVLNVGASKNATMRRIRHRTCFPFPYWRNECAVFPLTRDWNGLPTSFHLSLSSHQKETSNGDSSHWPLCVWRISRHRCEHRGRPCPRRGGYWTGPGLWRTAAGTNPRQAGDTVPPPPPGWSSYPPENPGVTT